MISASTSLVKTQSSQCLICLIFRVYKQMIIGLDRHGEPDHAKATTFHNLRILRKYELMLEFMF